MKDIIVDTWVCDSCGAIHTSDSSETHNLTMCKCGKSGYDLEEFYSRTLGDMSVLKRVIYDKAKIHIKKVIHYCGSCSQALPNHKLTCAYNEHSPKKYFLNLGLDNVKWYNKLWSWVISKLKQ